MAAPETDPNIAALDPQIRELRKAQARETLGDVGRVLLGQPRPPPKDYTNQRIKLIEMLSDLSKMETELRAEKEKTGRVKLSTDATIIAALAKIEVAKTTGLSDQQVARINSITKDSERLEDVIKRDGTRTTSNLGDAAVGSINELGKYVRNGDVIQGQEAAFAAELLKGMKASGNLVGADRALPLVYVQAAKEKYGVDVGMFLTEPRALAVPAVVLSINPLLDAATLQQEKNDFVRVEALAQHQKNREEILRSSGVDPGSALGKDLLSFYKVTGLDKGADTGRRTTVSAPAENAPVGEKQKFFDSALADGSVKVSDDGNTVTLTAPDGSQQSTSYAFAANALAGDGGAVTGIKVTDFIDKRMDHVLKELDRLENATDLDSVRKRAEILSMPALAAWAKENGYEDFPPEMQLKALLPQRRKYLQEQNAAFRAKFDADMIEGKGGVLGKAVASVRDLLRPKDERVGPEARRKREDSADMTGGAQSPDARTENTGATESDPRAVGPATKDTASMARLGEGTAGTMPIDVEGERQQADVEAEAKTQKMTAESAARPERTLPADSAMDAGLMLGRAKKSLSRVGDDPVYAEIAGPLKAAVEAGDSAEAGRLSRELDRAVGRRSFPLGKGEGESLGTDLLGPVVGIGREMPDEAKARAKAEYDAARAKAGEPLTIPQGRRGTLTGPSQEAVDAFNATLPPVDETDAPEPPVEPPSDEGVDTMPAAPEGMALASAEEPEVSPVVAAEMAMAGDAARTQRQSRLKKYLSEEGAEPAAVAAAPTATSAQAQAQQARPTSSTPTFQSFGAEAATQAAGQAMSNYLSAEDQLLRSRRRRAYGLGTAEA